MTATTKSEREQARHEKVLAWLNARGVEYRARLESLRERVPDMFSRAIAAAYAEGDASRDAELDVLRAENERLRDLAADAVSALRYIEVTYGQLAGVGWDRVLGKASAIAAAKPDTGEERP